jgi:hypothetical protein
MLLVEFTNNLVTLLYFNGICFDFMNFVDFYFTYSAKVSTINDKHHNLSYYF